VNHVRGRMGRGKSQQQRARMASAEQALGHTDIHQARRWLGPSRSAHAWGKMLGLMQLMRWQRRSNEERTYRLGWDTRHPKELCSPHLERRSCSKARLTAKTDHSLVLGTQCTAMTGVMLGTAADAAGPVRTGGSARSLWWMIMMGGCGVAVGDTGS
jgi:hypothetical protein